MLVVTRFREDESDVVDAARAALAALAQRPGYVRGWLGRAADDAGLWVLLTEWQNVGAWRRALGAYDVKVAATPLLSRALPEPSGFEIVLEQAAP